jgi:ABC-type nitrate/sulfonate/bicarbonate transport system substrate-binding protein
VAVAAICSLGAPALAQTITISTVQSVPSASNYIAQEKGYFREAGVDVRIEGIDSLSRAMAILATNQIQIAQGGVNAGYFNAVAQGLPVIMALESGSTPVYHNFVLRPDLKDKIRTPADLKGRNVAVSGAGCAAAAACPSSCAMRLSRRCCCARATAMPTSLPLRRCCGMSSHRHEYSAATPRRVQEAARRRQR